MVFQKRLDYGSSGYQVPAMPRVPKSAKGKRSVRKKFQDNPMRAFELLATLAGKLLLEKEKSSSPTDLNGIPNPSTPKNSVKQGQLDEEKPFKPEAFVQGSCDDSTLGLENGFQRQAIYASNELSRTPKTIVSVPYSLIPKSDPSDRDAFVARSIRYGSRDESKCPLSVIANKGNTDGRPPESAIYEGKADDGSKSALQDVRQKSAYLTEVRVPDKHASDDTREAVAKPPVFVSSDSSVEVPLCGDRMPHKSSFPKSRDDMELDVDRDDDENSSGCTHPSTITPKHIRPKFIKDHKMRKLLTSTYWKVAPRLLKDGEFSNNVSDVETQAGFNNKRMGCTRQRTHRSLFKRRKVFERYSMSASDSGMGSKGIYIPPIRNGSEIELNELRATARGVNGASTSMADKRSSYESDDFHVKLSIKSFKVPELYIEMPETATVGALKRTVMEAVTAILEGGLRVGVLLQGKKVRDDSKTLLQAGISHNHKMDNLGFSLEPNSSQALQPFTSSEDPCFVAPHNSTGPLTRIPAAAPVSEAEPSTPILEPPLTSMVNSPESGYDSVHSTSNISFPDKTSVNSQALVAVPPMNLEPMAVVPLHKSKRSELVQRRIRRPFSVSEVEALVQAVEKLGTGRWRDVKLRAFDNAKHRTYVDLKDKWKTLVHTAKISPQQRRGEPVPQELLDRVLLAHAYWSQQQAKLQVKPQQAQACLLF